LREVVEVETEVVEVETGVVEVETEVVEGVPEVVEGDKSKSIRTWPLLMDAAT
jgi:hypothetical protein